MNVVHRGFHSGKSKKGRGQTISSYYFQVDDFDPFAGPKKHAGRLAAPFWERKHTQQWADESASAWRYLFRHDAVMKALRVNRLLLGRHMQVDVHYGFLSGFRPPVEARLRGDLRRELAGSGQRPFLHDLAVGHHDSCVHCPRYRHAGRHAGDVTTPANSLRMPAQPCGAPGTPPESKIARISAARAPNRSK